MSSNAKTRAIAYLAGPDVFLPDAVEAGRIKREICAQHGIEAHYPLDGELSMAEAPPRDFALAISAANEALIRRSTMVLANLSPFRSPGIDSGTAYEMGFGRALGLVVHGYSNSAIDFGSRTRTFLGLAKDAERDNERYLIEDFGLADNLMMEGAIAASGGRLVCVPSSDLAALAAFERLIVEIARKL
jgi:nucleoside 2-deoxyribosyltransferase